MAQENTGLSGESDTEEVVSDPTPMGSPATQAELDTEHVVSITSPAAMNSASIAVPTTPQLHDPDVSNKISIPGVTAGTVTYTPQSTDDEINNTTLNVAAESLKENINLKLSELANNVTQAIGTVNTDMVAQIGDFNSQLDSFKISVLRAFDDLKLSEVEQNDGIASEVNRIAGTLLENIRVVAEGVADAQSKIAAIDDLYGSSSDTAKIVSEIQGMIDTLRGTDLSALQAVDGAIDAVNGMTRVFQKEVEMTSSTGRYNFNLALEEAPSFAVVGDYVVTANVVNNPQAMVFIENKKSDSVDLLVKSYGRHYVPQPVDGATTPVLIAVSITHAPTAKLTNVVPVLKADGSGTDNVTVGEEPVVTGG